MSDVEGPRVFDMPHARVTLTPIGGNVEIEVWPKTGQSAYAVVDPNVAVLIARQLVELAGTQLALEAEEGDVAGSSPERTDDRTGDTRPDNVVDLASRRPPRGRAS
jgi:hypothetical protein